MGEQTLLEQITSSLNINRYPIQQKEEKENNLKAAFSMKLNVWIENILSQISNRRNNCSIYVIIYVLSQIAFTTFCYKSSNDLEEEETTNNVLSEIQSRALSILNRIEKETENDELDKQGIIENVIEWMQGTLNRDECNIWIAHTAKHEMAHFVNQELQINKKLNTIKEKTNQIIQKQSRTCLKMSVLQPFMLVSSISVVLFCFWLQSIQSEQNRFW